jgi:hypothetical protein
LAALVAADETPLKALTHKAWASSPTITAVDRHRAFQRTKLEFCRAHTLKKENRRACSPEIVETGAGLLYPLLGKELANDVRSVKEAERVLMGPSAGLYDHPLCGLRYPMLMSLLDLHPEIAQKAKKKKESWRQTKACLRLQRICKNQSRNKKFASTAFAALQKWRDVQAKVDADLVGCTLVTVDVLKKEMHFNENIQFSGGGADIQTSSGRLLNEISRALNSLEDVLREMKEPMLHFGIDGHVHPTKDPKR